MSAAEHPREHEGPPAAADVGGVGLLLVIDVERFLQVIFDLFSTAKGAAIQLGLEFAPQFTPEFTPELLMQKYYKKCQKWKFIIHIGVNLKKLTLRA